MLIHLVFFVFNRYYTKKQLKIQEKTDVGAIFIEFFKFFVEEFNYKTQGLGVRRCFLKDCGDYGKGNLVLVNFDGLSEMGYKVKKFDQVQDLFEETLNQIQEMRRDSFLIAKLF